MIHQMLEKTTQTKEKEEKKIEEKNEKRRQFLNVHDRATSYVNPAEDDEEDNEEAATAEGVNADSEI